MKPDTTTKRFAQAPDSYPAVTLMRNGYVPTAPLVPSTAFKVEVLELYRLISKYHRRLGLQPYYRAIREYYGNVELTASAHALSRAYDCYLAVRRAVDKKIQEALGRTEGNARLLRSCSACLYILEDEPKLEHDMLLEIDGNMSQKRFKNAGTSDIASFVSPYILKRTEVEKFVGVAQVRKKASKKGAKKGGEGTEQDEAPNEADIQDAELETRPEGREADEAATQSTTRHERGDFPLENDPLEDMFGHLQTDCVERWKANADDTKKVMWDCFEECGIFACLCRHGHIFIICDIIQSGEQ
jgi:hypothetical protein